MTFFSPGRRISALFAMTFVTLGVQVPFFPVLLAHRGLGDFEIAVVVAVPMVLRLSTVSLLGILADRIGDRRKALALYTLAALVGVLALGAAHDFLGLVAATAAMALFANGIVPVSDAIATSAARRGEAVYGQMRLWGSIAFVATNLVAGQMIGLFDGGIVYPLLLVGAVLQVLAVAAVPKEPPAAEPAAEARPRFWDGMKSLVGDRALMTVLAGSALVQASHAMLYGFASLHWRSMGFSGGEIGMLWAVSVVGEVMLFARAEAVIGRIGAPSLLVLGAVGAMVRWSLFAAGAESGAVWVVLQLTHAASFAMTHLGTMDVITRSVGPQRAATAQGLTTTLTGTAMALGTFASGPLYGRFGGTAFLAMAFLGAAGLVVYAIGFRRARQRAAAA